jgi:hypothetical protein
VRGDFGRFDLRLLRCGPSESRDETRWEPEGGMRGVCVVLSVVCPFGCWFAPLVKISLSPRPPCYRFERVGEGIKAVAFG